MRERESQGGRVCCCLLAASASLTPHLSLIPRRERRQVSSKAAFFSFHCRGVFSVLGYNTDGGKNRKKTKNKKKQCRRRRGLRVETRVFSFFSSLSTSFLFPLLLQIVPHGQPPPVVHDGRPVVLPDSQKGHPRHPPSSVGGEVDAGRQPQLLPGRKVKEVFGEGDPPGRRRGLRPRVQLQDRLGPDPHLVPELVGTPRRDTSEKRVPPRAVRDARGGPGPGERRSLQPPGRIGVRDGRSHDLLDARGELEASRDSVELADDLKGCGGE
jgi:hypothetical protein